MKEKITLQMPPYREIPDVGLYLDQVTRYLNGILEEVASPVTPSMLSNYVKLKIVSKADHKTYSRDQIARFLFISLAKSVLSMDQIRQTLAILEKTFSVEEGYTLFKTDLEELLARGSLAVSDKSEDRELLKNIAEAVVHKMALDQYFRCRQAA
jgi:DNA-binding transcriptional MerR regulator